jgi:hypothetical protein
VKDKSVRLMCNVSNAVKNSSHTWICYQKFDQCHGDVFSDLLLSTFSNCHKQIIAYFSADFDGYFTQKNVPEMLMLRLALKAMTNSYMKQ